MRVSETESNNQKSQKRIKGVEDHLQTLRWRLPARPIEKFSVRRLLLWDTVAAVTNRYFSKKKKARIPQNYCTSQFDANHTIYVLIALSKYFTVHICDYGNHICQVDIGSIEAFLSATTIALSHKKCLSGIADIWIQSLNFAMFSPWLGMNRKTFGKHCSSMIIHFEHNNNCFF